MSKNIFFLVIDTYVHTHIKLSNSIARYSLDLLELRLSLPDVHGVDLVHQGGEVDHAVEAFAATVVTE